MKKIVQFILRMEIGGAQDIVKKYALYLDKNEFDVTILVYTPKTNSSFEKELEDRQIHVIYVGELIRIRTAKEGMRRRIERQIKSMIKLYSVINEIKPDVFHIHSELFRVLVALPFQKWGTKLVFTCHSEAGIIFKKKFNLWCAKYFCKKYNMKIIALSNKHSKVLSSLFGSSQVTVIKNGIDINAYRKSDSKESYITQRYSLTDKYVVGHVGRFSYAKNHPFIIWIFDELCRKMENAVLILVGTGECKKEIKELVNRLELTERVIFLEDRCDVPEILNALDVFLFPSLFEGIPLALIEAQAANLLCVVSDTITKDVIVTPQVIRLSLERKIEDWVSAVLGNGSREICADSMEEYNIYHCIKKLSKLYQNMCERGIK